MCLYSIMIRHRHHGGDIVYKAYKFRLYPNNKQKELIHKTFGCTRFIYNYFLSECKEK